MHTAARSLTERSADLLEALRARAPLVQCITNTVVQTVTANTLLALGAAPAMVDVVGEAGVFAGAADALLVNLGTPHPEQRAAAIEAATAADGGTPWVLDPVAIGALPVRTALAARLLDLGPTIVRGNASEVLALAGDAGGGRGTDSTAAPDDALRSAQGLAGRRVAAVAVSGAVDLVVAQGRTARIANGTPMLTRVTGGGCALGAVTAAFAAVTGDAFEAAVAATLAYTVAAQTAATRSAGPGSFGPAVLDALAAIRPEDLRRLARVEVDADEAVSA